MTATNNIRDIFSVLHDGAISSWEGDKSFLTLTVDCQYLSELIDKSFDRFYVELLKVDKLFLETWPNPFDLPVQTLTELNDIFKADLELLSAEIKDGKVEIACNQHDIDFDYCGGTLTISCETIKIYDQDKNELTVEQINILSNKYWNNASDQLEQDINQRNLK